MPDDAAFLRALDTDSSAAWRALPGCESPQPDPYTPAFVDSLFTTLTPRQRLRWADVEARWTSALLEQSAWMAATRAANECSDMLLVSVYRGEIAAALCSKLSSVGVLRRWLEFRRHLAAAVSAGGPDAAFVLDLSDRADVDIGLPKLASTGGCAANLPIPFALKGYGFNAWFSELGPSWRWPATAVGWAQRRAGAVWRGAKRSYGACVHATGGAWPPAAGTDGAARCSPGQRACYASNASVASARRTQLRRRCGAGGGARCAARGAVRHPREVAVDAELSDLDAGFVRSDGALNASAQLVVARLPPQRAARGGRGGRAAAVARSSYVKREQLSFADLAHWRAVLVLDGFGYATSLAAAMTLGAAVVAPHSLYPMWFEGLLRDGDDVVRVDPSLDDLSGALRELRTQPERARRLAAAASRRACALFAPAHLASYVRRLLDRYAHAFDGAYPRELHERVRRLAAGATLAPAGGGGGGGEVPVAAPEAPRLCARLYPRGQRGNLAC